MLNFEHKVTKLIDQACHLFFRCLALKDSFQPLTTKERASSKDILYQYFVYYGTSFNWCCILQWHSKCQDCSQISVKFLFPSFDSLTVWLSDSLTESDSLTVWQSLTVWHFCLSSFDSLVNIEPSAATQWQKIGMVWHWIFFW